MNQHAAIPLIFADLVKTPATFEETLAPEAPELFNPWTAKPSAPDPEVELEKVIHSGDPHFARTQTAAKSEPRFRFTKREAAPPTAASEPARIETKEIDGYKWSYGYSADGELVSANIINDSAPIEILEKRSSVSRRKQLLKGHILRQLAGGESIENLVSFAERHDPETARLIAEIGSDIQADDTDPYYTKAVAEYEVLKMMGQ